jgi:hypothetical protein
MELYLNLIKKFIKNDIFLNFNILNKENEIDIYKYKFEEFIKKRRIKNKI